MKPKQRSITLYPVQIRFLFVTLWAAGIFLSGCNLSLLPTPVQEVPSTLQASSGPADESPTTRSIAELPPPPNEISLPPGFGIHVYAEGVPNARSMSLSPNGTLFVGTRTSGNLYAIVDEDKDFVADEVIVLAQGMRSPNGVAFRDGSLYVAEVTRILRYDNIEADLYDLPDPVVVTDVYPSARAHSWKFIRFGPDGKLYVPVGAPCNVCDTDDTGYGTITRIDADGENLEFVAQGVRNTVGFDWDPRTDELWFTDNGRDNLGDDLPPDELNHITEENQHFGFPYCHGGTVVDTELEHERTCDEFTPPAMPLGPHVAALGMRFYTGEMFPEEYHNQIIIAEHGSWNRSTPIGYRLSLVRVEDNQAVSYETFAEGWLVDGQAWGRPVDVLVMPDGSLLVSDDSGGMIYRIVYE
ncbi:MAG: sorbosone dehydrogenase family protein [Chloroflexota bacterium]